MLYDEKLDRPMSKAIRVNIYCPLDAYDEMYKWCVAQDIDHRFASEINCHKEDFIHFNGNGGHGAFYFVDEQDALLFRLRWGHEIR